MEQAHISALLRLESPIVKERINGFPLANYALKDFADHAQLRNAISDITDTVNFLPDAYKPHAAWMSSSFMSCREPCCVTSS